MSHAISLTNAIDMTKKFRDEKNNALSAGYQGMLSVCETFDKAAFDTLLATSGCAKVRIYFGLDVNSKMHAIIVAADANDNDILPDDSTIETNMIIDKGITYPPGSTPASPLNS